MGLEREWKVDALDAGDASSSFEDLSDHLNDWGLPGDLE